MELRYPEREKFHLENERIGYYNGENLELFDISNIWICELYQNKTTKEYSVLIHRDSDEQEIVVRFDKIENPSPIKIS